jgi:release factor glutamine methyltransferase
MIKGLAEQLPGDSAWLDAQVLLARITGHNRAWLLSHPEASLSSAQLEELNLAIHQLQNGMPLPYVLGRWEFFGLQFMLTPDVLIPRPETELLVETALAYIRSRPRATFRILDVGTGSGIIPISLAAHAPHASFVATDISAAALKVARANAEQQGLSQRIEFVQADLLPEDFSSTPFDMITANLPYIPTETLHSLEIFGKEPTLALDGGADGLDLIQRLLEQLAKANVSESLILLEIEAGQRLPVQSLVRENFPTAGIELKKDLAGHDRLIIVDT